MKILYFAWLKEKTGISEEDCPLPEGVVNVSDLMGFLAQRGAGFTEAFANMDVVRVAVNQEHVAFDWPLSEHDEVAFFPPVTGG